MQPLLQPIDRLRKTVSQFGRWELFAYGMLLLVAVVSLIELAGTESKSSREYLLDGRVFSKQELTTIQFALANAGLGDYETELGRVRIPQAERSTYLAALANANAIPAGFHQHIDEVLDKTNLFESRRQQEMRLQHAREKAMASNIRTMDGIDDVTVHYDYSSTNSFPRRKLAKALVGVICSKPLSIEQANNIRYQVAGANVDLNPQDITITDLKTGSVFAGDKEIDEQAQHFAIKQSLELEWSEKIRSVLHYVPSAQVVVNIEPSQASDSSRVRCERISISVGIPSSYIRQRQTRPGAEAESLPVVEAATKREMREAITALLPATQNMTTSTRDDLTDSTHSVVVTTFADHPSPIAATGLRWRQAAIWLRPYQRPLTLFGLGSIILLAGCLLLKRTAQPEDVVSPVLESTTAVPENLETDEDDLRDQLKQLVRNDPDQAAKILSNWLGDAA